MTLETPIERMYRAGKQDIPEAAQAVSGVAAHLSGPTSECDVQAAKAGDPKLMRNMLEVLGEVHAALRRATISLNGCAEAMIITADDFVATDGGARQDFNSLNDGLRQGEVPQAYEPSPIGNPEAPGATREVWPDYLKPGMPIEDQSRTETHESTPDPSTSPDDDLEERDEAADDAEPDVPEGESQ